MQIRMFALIGALVFAGTACGGDDDAATNPTPSPNTVNATDGLKFEPATLTVSVGTTVTWVAGSAQPHDATSDTGAAAPFKVDIPKGGNGSFRFDKAGTYPYYCTIHGKTMAGSITVQ